MTSFMKNLIKILEYDKISILKLKHILYYISKKERNELN